MADAAVVLSGGDVAIFASDMHLGDHDPATADRFLASLERVWPQASHLFLLGDLFEAWVGDDQPDAVAARLCELLRRVSDAGCRVFVMRGNRDFLMDEPGTPAPGFTLRTASRLLDDPCRVDLFGEPVVLTHGDALCTSDTAYQEIRRLLRSPAWREAAVKRSLTERLVIARDLRERSEREQAGRDPTDVTVGAVETCLRQFQVRTMIHGHTHRPAHHVWALDDAPAHRWVLPDWDAKADRGGFLRVDRDGFRMIV